MARFLQTLFDGLSSGSIYALLALGLVVIYRGTGHLNLTQGEVAMFAAFVAWQVHAWGIPLGIAIFGGIVFGFVVSAITEVAIVRPLQQKSEFAPLVAMIAIFLMFSSLASAIWGAGRPEIMPSIFPSDPDDFVRIFGATIRIEILGIMLVSAALYGLLMLLFNRTKFGLAMRGVASNLESARLVGVRTGQVLTLTWALAGALGAVAGILVASRVGEVTPGLMFTYFVYGAAAAALGGFDSLGGSVVAGLGLGVAERVAADYVPNWIGNQMALSVALLTMFVVLVFRPAGLWGSERVERV